MIHRHLAATCGATIALLAPAALRAQSVRYVETTSAGVPLKVIDVNLNDPNVKVTGQLPKYGCGYSEPFGQMIHRTVPTVAVTGTFFCTHTRIPIGDIVIDGKLEHFGGMGTALCITDDNKVEFVKPQRNTHQDWSRFDFVLCCGPRLVTDGVPYVEPWSEGFHDKHMLNRNGRLAIGVTRYNHLYIVATRQPIYLSKLARAMRHLGVVNAINLDAGSSMGLHYKGHTLIRPSRWLTNLVLVYQDRDRYEAAKDRLAPQLYAGRRHVSYGRHRQAEPTPLPDGSGSKLELNLPPMPPQPMGPITRASR